MSKLLDVAIWFVQFCIVAVILVAVAYYGAHAWIAEDDARVAKLEQHLYDIAMGRGTYGPEAPTGVRLAPGDLAEPRTRVFQDVSQPKKGWK